MRRLREWGLPLVAGLLMGLGLMISGMVQPGKVQGFLDIGGLWDPSLGLVMGGAIAVTLPVFQWLQRRTPVVPHGPIESRLIVGSLLFGVGWGLSGYCPGPALVTASSGSLDAVGYVVAMGLGMGLGHRFGARERPGP
ncbi:DUF6691 family protein [Zoogloea sp.]|uniref:DUF6691 family protein n=1 Tax=Zoogloea sp. TaxID=49181 RepID=UPI00345802C3